MARVVFDEVSGVRKPDCALELRGARGIGINPCPWNLRTFRHETVLVSNIGLLRCFYRTLGYCVIRRYNRIQLQSLTINYVNSMGLGFA